MSWAMKLASVLVATLFTFVAPAHHAAAASTVDWWHPAKGLSWQWQLSGTLDSTVKADVYDVDAFETPSTFVAGLHAAGRKAICYVNVGAYEDWRPDAGRFPVAVLGKDMDGWP